eukprot:TRINITY_DN14240_c0_g1_i1.p2 TRINITY_DN14240_c0_g1~~TRINITY_DN14240_c0_g1_i1.p2  ORF type:complete len:184 (-),score=41.05 TRINITY_DN14240_c0_g1_i1:64-615(-)
MRESLALAATLALHPAAATEFFGNESSWVVVEAHLRAALALTEFSPTCGGMYCADNINSYVYAHDAQHRVFLCKSFFDRSLEYGSWDTAMGCLLHELTHFDDVAGTRDYAYGPSACRALALADPTRASTNADSHQCYLERCFYGAQCRAAGASWCGDASAAVTEHAGLFATLVSLATLYCSYR